MLIRVLAAITLLAVAVTWVPWSAQPASACTCAQRDPVTMLNEADAAFVGRPIAHEIPNDGPVISSADPVVYTFEVERAVKGDIGDQVEVHSLRLGASCGIEFLSPTSNRSGITLHLNEDGTFSSGLCDMVDPDELLQYSQPMSPSPGRAPSDAESVPASDSIDPVSSSDLADPGRGIPAFTIYIVLGLAVFGYALWRFVLRNRHA